VIFEGYNLVGPSKVLTCTASTTYDFPPPSCVPVDCGSPTSPQNGYIELLSSGTTYLHNASYVCHVGYQLDTGKEFAFYW